jgi:hypothetical protein
MAHVQGDDDGGGFGIEGTSTRAKGTGVYGYSETGPGICGLSIGPVSITGIALDPTAVTHGHPPPVGTPMVPPYRTAVYGVNSLGHNTAGVLGQNDPVGGYGVLGISDKGHGVRGLNDTNSGGSGMQPDKGSGASGDSTNGYGVWGASRNWAGVGGFSQAYQGVHGESQNWEGVRGIGHGGGAGVAGFNDAPAANAQPGVWGESQNGEGVHGVSHNPFAAAIAGYGAPGGLAGYFDGSVKVTGDIFMPAADFAEDLTVQASDVIEPGTVMVLDRDGMLRASDKSYDKKVAGVISGAGDYRPGLILDRHESSSGRLPVALVGKVYCKADATFGAIEVGDLLTTSPTPGHAMKAADQLKAFGAVIGKAMGPLESSRGLIPILIALQ